MRVLDEPLDRDLEPFSHFLWQNRVRHRVYQHGDRQILELSSAADAPRVRRAFAAWCNGELELPRVVSVPATDGRGVVRAWSRYPITLGVLAGALIVFTLTGAGTADNAISRALYFVDIAQPTLPIADLMARGELWRWLTPVFLHFSLVHILFNSLVVWELGRRIEPSVGSLRFVALFVAMAVVSHWAQFFVSGPFFGGLSGVGYGLLAYVVMRARQFPADPLWRLPPGFAVSLLVMLVAFTAGVGDLFGIGVANAAHWGGLLTGLVLAGLSGASGSSVAASDNGQ
ncbi:MAG: rhomboid family intramembrane serine protease [Pseudomonadota bacterium]